MEKKPDRRDLLVRFTGELKLIFRLMRDKRVKWWAKLLPVVVVIYALVPDLMPGPFDDTFVLWLGTLLFIELCPPKVVEEHRENIAGENDKL